MFEILNYKPQSKSCLKATFSVRIPKWGGFIIHEISYFEKNNAQWITFPSRQYEKDGQKKYFQLNAFDDIKMMHAFQKKVLESLHQFLTTYEAQG